MNLDPRRLIVSTCLTLLLATAAQAATLVVDDNLACPGATFSTITAALAAASPTGDTIQVCDGSYTEGTILVSKEVVIDGVNRDATLVNVATSGLFGFHIQADNVTISDLTIQEVGGAAVTGANGIRYESASPLDNEVVSNVKFLNFDDGSARAIEVHDATMNDFTVTNSIFLDNLYGIRMSSNSHINGMDVTGSSFSSTTNANNFSRIGIYGSNDGATSTFNDLQATGNTFTNLSLAGIFVEELQNSLIGSNVFTGNYTGIIIDKRYVNSNTPLTNVEIAGNTFTDNTGRAVFISALTLGLGSGVVIDGNTINVDVSKLLGPTARGAITTNFQGTLTHSLLTISDNSFTFSGAFGTATTTWGVQLVGDGPVAITGNTFDGNDVVSSGTPPFAAVYIQSTSSTLGTRNDAVTITCNDILDFVHGITVYDLVAAQGGGLPGGTVIDVHSNNIVGNSAFGIYNGATDGSSATIDAEGNWWGATDGPGGQGPGSGDAISANVDAVPFLTGPASGCTALSITKTSAPNPVTAGQQLTYTITVTNSGTAAADGVVVNDTLPASFTGAVTSGCAEDPSGGSQCTLGTIAAGSSASYTITGTVSPSATGTITNTATLSATGVPADAFDDTATEQTAVSVSSALDLEKSVVTSGPFATGATVVFRLDVTNNGPSDATGVVVTDVLPAGLQFSSSSCATNNAGTVTWNVGALAGGAHVSCEFSAIVTGTATVTNTATVSGSGGASDTASARVNVIPPTIPASGTVSLLLMAALLVLSGTWLARRS